MCRAECAHLLVAEALGHTTEGVEVSVDDGVVWCLPVEVAHA